MHRRTLLGAFVAPLLTSCGGALVTDYCYRFAVRVQIRGAVKEGASIIRVRWRQRPPFALGGPLVHATVWAEAPFVELEREGDMLIALLHQAQPQFSFPAFVLPSIAVDAWRSGDMASALRQMPALTQEFEVPLEYWPALVRLRDADDPSSMEEITRENAASKLGGDAEIERLTMQVVRDAPTQEIAQLLPWLSTLDSDGAPAVSVQDPLTARVRSTSFRLWNVTV